MRKEYMENNKNSSPRITRMTLNYGPPPKRRRQEGDKKMIKGVLHICVQQTTTQYGQRMYLVNRGRPMLEWVPYDDYKKERGL
jgi:hypothetical protein